MNIERGIQPPFSVIGKEGSTDDGQGFIQQLWADANAHFDQIAHLIRKDAQGMPLNVWGAMSDFSRSFRPWQNDFTQGLYLAGAECETDAIPPDGWTRWDVPGFEYLRVLCDHRDIFPQMLAYLEQNHIPLSGAVHDYTCPATGLQYMVFPIRML